MRLQERVRELSVGRIPGLDGIRAISITLVLSSHAMIHEGLLSGRALGVQYIYGEDGVVFFFALSGFLITALLLREQERTGRIGLRAFYLRRTLRIWPVWYAYMLAVLVMVGFGWWSANGRSWWGAATYTLNLIPNTNSIPLSHAWSLAIEEQFYLLWPVALIWLLRSRTPLHTLAVVVATAPLWRAAIWYGVPWTQQFGRHATPQRAGALLAGCLVAMVLAEPSLRERYRQLVSARTVLLAVGLVLVEPFLEIAARSHATEFTFTIGLSMSELPLAFLVGAVAVSPTSAVVRSLSWWPVALLGLMSYSLYVWQQAFVLQPQLPLAVGLLVALVAAFWSWHLIELRSGRLKDRLSLRSDAARVEVGGRVDLPGDVLDAVGPGDLSDRERGVAPVRQPGVDGGPFGR